MSSVRTGVVLITTAFTSACGGRGAVDDALEVGGTTWKDAVEVSVGEQVRTTVDYGEQWYVIFPAKFRTLECLGLNAVYQAGNSTAQMLLYFDPGYDNGVEGPTFAGEARLAGHGESLSQTTYDEVVVPSGAGQSRQNQRYWMQFRPFAPVDPSGVTLEAVFYDCQR